MLPVLSQVSIKAQDRSRSEPIQSGPLPDLVVERVDVLDSFKVQVIIKNHGEGKLLHAFLVDLRIYDRDGQLLKRLRQGRKPPLDKGSMLILHFDTEGQTLAGNRFEVEVDVGNINKESNENNNGTRRTDGPGEIVRKANEPPGSSAGVDLAAINVFPATAGNKNVIQGVVRNLGTTSYSGSREKRRATITLTTQKMGRNLNRFSGLKMYPTSQPAALSS